MCVGFNPKHLMKLSFMMNSSFLEGTHWSSAGATWYGAPNGAGRGACGYGKIVSQPPFSSMVKCTEHPRCSGKPVRVVITDFCPGDPCSSGPAHFDLSGTAFGAMAIRGREDELRSAGVLEIRYARIPCDYSGKTIAFHIDTGSNPNYIAMVIEYEEGDGDLGSVALMEESSGVMMKKKKHSWRTMQQSWGAVWKLDAGSQLQAPISIKLTSRYSAKTLIAKNVIPKGWKPGSTYRSFVNYL
ncbi:putative expansin-B2 [Senna tora]|uniref:Putative expansin-B2 n=1 Tax=Senna tora TaxID=362788 RepID=A0A835CC68_9FABA|nr:putative expansin-B2 [Senna tora]